MTDPVTKIAQTIKNAEVGQRTATIHYEALAHAKELDGIDLVQFCKEAHIPESYGTEIRKMIALHKYMEQKGIKIAS